MQKPITFSLHDIINAASEQGRSPNFLLALPFTLAHEGLYWEQVGGDPGGATCCGIDQADYDAYRSGISKPHQPVADISAAEVADDYYRRYWLPLKCDDFLYPLALALFDTGVNTGVGEAAMFLERVLGIPADGVIGPNCEAVEHEYVMAHGVVMLANAEVSRRDAYYEEIGAPGKELNQFLAGWLARDNDLRKAETAQ